MLTIYDIAVFLTAIEEINIKGTEERDFSTSVFSSINPGWIPKSQAKIFLNSFSFREDIQLKNSTKILNILKTQ